MATRSWLRIHLSTAVLLMLTGAALIWINTRMTTRTVIVEFGKSGAHTFKDEYTTREYGWPFQATEHKKSIEHITDPAKRPFGLSWASYTRMEWKTLNLAANIAIALLVLALVAALCEWRIRRHKLTRTS